MNVPANMPVIQSGHEICGQEPRGRLEPDPIFAAIGDLPSAHLLRRRRDISRRPSTPRQMNRPPRPATSSIAVRDRCSGVAVGRNDPRALALTTAYSHSLYDEDVHLNVGLAQLFQRSIIGVVVPCLSQLKRRKLQNDDGEGRLAFQGQKARR
jgi:hypothetical protein